VFTELIHNLGVSGVQVDELYDLSEEGIESLQSPVYGLVFLFKWKGELVPRETTEPDNGLFFANQVVHNACATQAILAILLNQDGQVELGTELNAFQEFTVQMPAEVKGLAIGNSDLIRSVHNSFARPESFAVEDKQASSDSEAFHFISYVPYRGVLYELDGLQKGAISHGACTPENWRKMAMDEIQSRMRQYQEQEIRFNLMALIQSRQDMYNTRISECNTKREALQAKIDAGGEDAESATVEMQEVCSEIARLSGCIEDELAKQRNWKVENMRRKHNYIPFLLKFLKILAEKGQLSDLVENAQKNM